MRNYSENALIVTVNRGVAKSAKYFTQKIKGIVMLDDDEMDGLLALYSLQENKAALTVVSLSLPEGRGAHRLIGEKEFTIEQLVAIGIYFLIPFRQIRRRFDFKDMNEEALDIMKEGMRCPISRSDTGSSHI